MIDNKKNMLKHQILQVLLENERITVSAMSQLLNKSEKNIRDKLEELNEKLKKEGLGTIHRIPGRGIVLKADSGSRRKIRELYAFCEQEAPADSEQRLFAYLRLLLSDRKKRLTVTELGELVFDSIPVCKRNLELCSQWLERFLIHLSVRRNYGIDIQGPEEMIRQAIKHLAVNDREVPFEDSIHYFARGLNLELLKSCIRELEASWHFSFAEESYNSVMLFAALAVTRSGNRPVRLEQEKKDIVVKYNEYALAKSFFSLIEDRFTIKISEDEILYFAIQMMCTQMISNEVIEPESGVREYDIKIKEFVRSIISVVGNITNTDLSQDRELYYGLLNHVRPAIFRMKFEKRSDGGPSAFIQEEYRKTWRLSWVLSALFEEYYGIQISSAELSYISLYIQAALERIKTPLEVLLITDSGMGMNQMFCSKIRQEIPNIRSIKIRSLHGLKPTDCRGFDLIITTTKLAFEDQRIVFVKSLLDPGCADELKEKIAHLKKRKTGRTPHFDVSCHNLFDPCLILIKPDVRDKYELLERMAGLLQNTGYITDQYLPSLLEREKAVSTCIGNSVAIPHGNSNEVNQSKVVVAVLDRPVKWNQEDEVQLVFMLGLRINTAFEAEKTQLFYKTFLEMIDSDQDVEKICGKSQEELYKLLVR